MPVPTGECHPEPQSGEGSPQSLEILRHFVPQNDKSRIALYESQGAATSTPRRVSRYRTGEWIAPESLPLEGKVIVFTAPSGSLPGASVIALTMLPALLSGVLIAISL